MMHQYINFNQKVLNYIVYGGNTSNIELKGGTDK